MIELLVVVIIIAILAAIAVPVYLNIKAGAARSALRQDVNTVVKRVSIALTNGVALNTVIADDTHTYIPANLPRGEVITIVADTSAQATQTAYTLNPVQTGEAFSTSTTLAQPDMVKMHTIAATDGDFYVYGSLAKAQGASTDYNYSYTSEGSHYSDGSGGSDAGAATVAPKLTARSLPDATVDTTYTNTTIAASGTPTPTFTATGLPSGMSLSTAGVLGGTPNDTAKTYTVRVTVQNSAGTDTLDYPLTLKAKAVVPTASYTTTVTGTTVSFDASASTNAASYAWNFGDGTTGTGVTVQHTYASAADYNTSLTVTSTTGNTDSATNLPVTTKASSASCPLDGSSTCSNTSIAYGNSQNSYGTGGLGSYGTTNPHGGTNYLSNNNFTAGYITSGSNRYIARHAWYIRVGSAVKGKSYTVEGYVRNLPVCSGLMSYYTTSSAGSDIAASAGSATETTIVPGAADTKGWQLVQRTFTAPNNGTYFVSFVPNCDATPSATYSWSWDDLAYYTN